MIRDRDPWQRAFAARDRFTVACDRLVYASVGCAALFGLFRWVMQ